MKTEEFIRLRRHAAENGWSVDQDLVPDSNETAATFTKIILSKFAPGGKRERKVRIFFEVEGDNTLIKACYYNVTQIHMAQVRSILENL